MDEKVTIFYTIYKISENKYILEDVRNNNNLYEFNTFIQIISAFLIPDVPDLPPLCQQDIPPKYMSKVDILERSFIEKNTNFSISGRDFHWTIIGRRIDPSNYFNIGRELLEKIQTRQRW
ncbi:MAG: hypothetical protein FJX71_02930 [Alphaproteobacteria bacterium]|nr:hypothetical protein [Alphaproteobacteria bacterium]